MADAGTGSTTKANTGAREGVFAAIGARAHGKCSLDPSQTLLLLSTGVTKGLFTGFKVAIAVNESEPLNSLPLFIGSNLSPALFRATTTLSGQTYLLASHRLI